MVTPILTALITELRDGLKARNAELSVHFSTLVILSKSLNEPLNKEFKNQITSHINSLSSEKDFFAYSFAYFLAKAVDHQSQEEILLKSESGNILFHRVNTFLENQ